VSKGTPVCWDPTYVKSGRRTRIVVEQVSGGMAHQLGYANSIAAARRYLKGVGPGEFRIIRVTHEPVATIRNKEKK
jgi:hypothetical protein